MHHPKIEFLCYLYKLTETFTEKLLPHFCRKKKTKAMNETKNMPEFKFALRECQEDIG